MVMRDVGHPRSFMGFQDLPLHLGRWLFIVDGIITIPLAILGYIFFPNLPQDGTKTWWLTEEQRILSVSRMKSVNRAGRQPWTKAKAKSILLSWHTYLLRTYIPHEMF